MAERDELQSLRGHLDDYLMQKGLPLRRAFRCLSPEHEDRNPSMSYHQSAQTVHCFACGATYDLLDLIGIDYNLDSFPERLQKARELFGNGSAAPQPKRSPKRTGKNHYPKLYTNNAPEIPLQDNNLPTPQLSVVGGANKDRDYAADKLSVPLVKIPPPPPYLTARGISAESCARWGIVEREGRVWFPVTENGRTVSWCGRALEDDTQPRYKNSAGPMEIWNIDRLAEAGGTLYITEGIIDAISIEQTGRRAIALCGSQNAAKLLKRLQAADAADISFVLCGDPDRAGRSMNETLRAALAGRGFVCAVLELAEADGDVNALYSADPDKLERLLLKSAADLSAHSAADCPPGQTEADYNATSAAGMLDAFFLERQRRAGRDCFSTGIAGLDNLLDGGLHTGLYVLGAISSLGKTSLALQIADCIAAGDGDVLFFSLEQGGFELMAKSLSRVSATLAGRREQALTSRELLSGRQISGAGRRKLLAEAREVYAGTAGGLFLREGLADIGAAEIRDAVREHIARRGKKPVVMVDYLQILRPFDSRATDKQSTDRSVVELRRLSRDYDIPVVAISSFNRENYRAAVSMEAFKESGAVEYSADVLLGLQLKGAGERDFDSNEAKLRLPRQLELVLLKNRNGIPYARLPLNYDARFGLFEEPASAAGIKSPARVIG